MRAAAERERLAEAVARQRERAEAARRDQVARRELQRAAQRLARLRVVGRIAGLARALLVREPELVERGDVVRVRANRPPAPSRRPPPCSAARAAPPRRRGSRSRRSRGARLRAGARPRSSPPPPLRRSISFRSRSLLQPGRRGPPAGRAPPPSCESRRAAYGNLVALVRRRDVRERVRERHVVRVDAVADEVVRALVRQAEARRPGSARSPERPRGARCR